MKSELDDSKQETFASHFQCYGDSPSSGITVTDGSPAEWPGEFPFGPFLS